MADLKNQLGTDGSMSVSALGLRWAALRGMLGSPLIEAEEQRPLRDDLLRELQALERHFAGVSARNATEISAKIDVAKAALRQSTFDMDGWLVDLLDSVQADLRSVTQGGSSGRFERSPVNLSRSTPTRAEQSAAAKEAAKDEDDEAAA